MDIHYNDGIKEQVFLYFNGQWRGQPCVITVQADRYTHSSGLSEWRVYPEEIRAGSLGVDGRYQDNRGPALTETARSRFRDVVVPVAMAWLESDAYRASEKASYARAILRDLKNAAPYYDSPTARVRERMAKYRAKLSQEQYKRLETACNAYDRYAVAYVEAGQAC